MSIFLKILRGVIISVIGLLFYMSVPFWMLSGMDDAHQLVPSTTFATLEALLPMTGDGLLPVDEEGPVLLESNPIYEEGVIYMPIAYIESHFDEDFYWDASEGVLTYTTINDVLRMRTDELTYYLNDEPLSLQIPIRELVEGVPYMPLEFLKKFTNHNFSYYEETGTLVVEDLSLDHTYVMTAPLTRDYAVVRTWKDSKSDIVRKLGVDEQLTLLSYDRVWAQVRTKEGLEGYILLSDVTEANTIAGIAVVKEVYDYATRTEFEGGLNLAWHYVGNVVANQYLDTKLDGVHDLDVISPTWFHIKDVEGNITNYADINYVRKAHSLGIQVWALFSNQFDSGLTHDVLSSTTGRQNVIRELLALSALYEVDGINVDFENVASEDGEYFVQFMKELTPYLKKQGLVVSVDMYVPRPWTAHYGREAVGEVVDYVMIMAYDEHWSTSPESGSVASIGFVEDGIVQTLLEVPAAKTVLGLPFYTRLWTETYEGGETKVKSKAYGMESGYDVMTDAGAAFIWLDDVKQYYAEYSDEDATYKMWLEDERSIEEKVKLMEKYDLAGVAGWQIGMENDATWDVLEDYLK